MNYVTEQSKVRIEVGEETKSELNVSLRDQWEKCWNVSVNFHRLACVTAELKMDVLREREVKDSLERQLQDEQKVRGKYERSSSRGAEFRRGFIRVCK